MNGHCRREGEREVHVCGGGSVKTPGHTAVKDWLYKDALVPMMILGNGFVDRDGRESFADRSVL